MQIEKVRVEGFRLLQDVEIMLEVNSTVNVGRNNSGKTSLTDVFDRFFGETGARFRLEDFSAASRSKFFNARALREKKASPEEILAVLPKIVLTLTFAYDSHASSLGPLAPFVIDLDVASTKAIVRIEYGPTLATLHTLLDIPSAAEGIDPNTHFLRSLRDTLPKAYSIQVCAIDPTDKTNRRDFEGTSALAALVQCNFVRAQRTLDHARHGDADDGQRTSNAAIKEWFRPEGTEDKEGWQITPAELVAKTPEAKQSGYRRIAYQIPQTSGTDVCARSYEDALVLANPDRFEWPKEQDEATEAWDIAKGLAKADTALRFAIREKEWTVPRYIQEGLEWLSKPPTPLMAVSAVENLEAPANAEAA